MNGMIQDEQTRLDDQNPMDDDPPPSRLTPTERRLLDVLRQNPGRVFSRAELVARVIPNAGVTERTIDVHIRALRKKLGGEARIRTLWRQGYAWAEGPQPPLGEPEPPPGG
jgi:DNA-binding response OmpR family regulator